MYEELYHHGVKGMKWGVRRNLRKSADFQESKKKVKQSHRKYWDAEGAYDSSVRKAQVEFDTKRPYKRDATRDETLEWEIDRYVHVLNKSHSAQQKRDRAKQEYKQLLDDTVNRYGNTLIGDVKVSERQRQRINRIIRDELVKDIFKD